MPRYNPSEIEPKWQQYWDRNQTFKTPEMPSGEKLYVLDMFPYPSGAGLHVGHPEGYTATDIVARFSRMKGITVLHPMGYDAFGLPAEEHAIKTNTPPRVSTEANIANFTRQLKMLGFSYDWDRVLATTDPDYFRWTQWIFLLIFDTWYDTDQRKGRPIAELPIPPEVQSAGSEAVSKYRDSFRLAYQDDALVNWCPNLGTVLANEEVVDGKSEVGGHPVQRIPLRQWMLRITSYADRLLEDLIDLDWSPGIKKLQADWIGRSQGAEVDFYIGAPDQYELWKSERERTGFPETPDEDCLRVFTTRPDTLFGATYMVVAPEHPLIEKLVTEPQKSTCEKYIEAASFKSDRDRTEGSKKKTGVPTGSTAINPANGERIPVWVADYVLAGYGTGAIMAVPAHDIRDYEFATEFGLPVINVVQPSNQPDVAHPSSKDSPTDEKHCFAGEGLAVNSGFLDGLTTSDAKTKITKWLEQRSLGKAAVNYKLRDWLFSRQRFWGEPFPILHELDDQGNPTGIIQSVSLDSLPVNLPELEDFKPHGKPEPPLAKAGDEWLIVTDESGRRYRRETNTMPQWAGSCWYYLRFIDPKNDQALVDAKKEEAWMPIDLYVGGAEHAVLHLLYSRFWHKVLFDRGIVSTSEPFRKLVNQGMILGEVEFTGLQDESGNWVSFEGGTKDDTGQIVHHQTQEPLKQTKLLEDDVVKVSNGFVLKSSPDIRVDSRANKMSKSRGNVVNPDEVVREYGADALRLYEMFMGPLEATKPWSMNGVSGVRNFLDRVWRLMVDPREEQLALLESVQEADLNSEQRRVVHSTIAAVTHDIEIMSFNTAISRMMEFVNFFTKEEIRPRSAMETLVLLLSPFAPHIAEELWRLLGHSKSLAYETWPAHDPEALKTATVEIPIQVNGKLRGRITVDSNATKAEIENAAMNYERIDELLDGKQVAKLIVVPRRMVNIVVK